MEKDAIAVMAIIMIRIGLTILALTAACPITKAPTIPMVALSGDGTRSPASLISSNEISITSTSKIMGNGTFSLEARMEKSSSVGSNSWWKSVKAIYNPGRSRVIPIANKRRNFKKFAN